MYSLPLSRILVGFCCLSLCSAVWVQEGLKTELDVWQEQASNTSQNSSGNPLFKMFFQNPSLWPTPRLVDDIQLGCSWHDTGCGRTPAPERDGIITLSSDLSFGLGADKAKAYSFGSEGTQLILDWRGLQGAQGAKTCNVVGGFAKKQVMVSSGSLFNGDLGVWQMTDDSQLGRTTHEVYTKLCGTSQSESHTYAFPVTWHDSRYRGLMGASVLELLDGNYWYRRKDRVLELDVQHSEQCMDTTGTFLSDSCMSPKEFEEFMAEIADVNAVGEDAERIAQQREVLELIRSKGVVMQMSLDAEDGWKKITIENAFGIANEINRHQTTTSRYDKLQKYKVGLLAVRYKCSPPLFEEGDGSFLVLRVVLYLSA